MDGSLSKEDLVQALESALFLFLRIQKANKDTFDAIDQKHKEILAIADDDAPFKLIKGQVVAIIEKEADRISGDAKKAQEGLESKFGTKLNSLDDSQKQLKEQIKKVKTRKGDKGDSIKGDPGDDADEEVIVEKVLARVPPPPEPEPDQPSELRDKLEQLQGEGRLSKNAIEGLDELETTVEELKKRPLGRSGQGGDAHVAFSIQRLVKEETPSGSINGSNVTFTTANKVRTGLFILRLNGAVQADSSVDYSRSGQTITMVTAPKTSDSLIAIYI